MAIGSQTRILGWKKKRGRSELAVVVTVAVTLSMAAAPVLTTCLFSWSVVPMAQLAFGAFVLQEKYTKPVPDVSPGVKVLELPVVAPAFTVIEGGFPRVGLATVEGEY